MSLNEQPLTYLVVCLHNILKVPFKHLNAMVFFYIPFYKLSHEISTFLHTANR